MCQTLHLPFLLSSPFPYAAFLVLPVVVGLVLPAGFVIDIVSAPEGTKRLWSARIIARNHNTLSELRAMLARA